MMRRLAVLVAVLSVASVGMAPPEFMLCFHSDGNIFVERFQELCCKSSCPEAEACDSDRCSGSTAPSECPDDECDDLPLTVSIEGTLDTPQVLSVGAVGLPVPVPAEPAIADLSCARDSRAPSHFLGPPVARPEPLLRTVVLRL